MGKKKAGPAAVAIAVVILVAIIYVIYHFTLGQTGPKPNPNTIPAYVRAHMSDADLAKLGISRPAPAANGANGAPAKPAAH